MDLNVLWFVLIAVLYTGYFVLEGFDFGVGILLPVLGKDDNERRVILNTIGPHWDGNEVWLITAGGATFAAFPNWYATLFSGFYLPLFLILITLIIRGVAFEFRSRDDNPLWRTAWDWVLFVGSLVPAFLWGVAFANMVHGVPNDSAMQCTGAFWNLLNPYAIQAGVLSLLGFTLHGSIFLTLKTAGTVHDKARRWSGGLWVATLVAALAVAAGSYTYSGVIVGFGWNAGLLLLAGILVLVLLRVFMAKGREGGSFILSTLGVLVFSAAIFAQLFPNVMVSSTDPQFNLTIYNAASGSYTLGVMSKVALFLVPLVLLYQGWTYWIFRKRISGQVEGLHY
jgi:cytochrome d ubiquinol oxidase subunit II